jgi:hypothetical protein
MCPLTSMLMIELSAIPLARSTACHIAVRERTALRMATG